MANTTYQVILSTDGKHTVIATVDDQADAKAAVSWANAVYDSIVAKHGLKYQQYERNGQHQQADESVPECGVHHVPMVKVDGKHGPFWSCRQRDDAGNFCSYRPQAQ